MKKIQMTEKQAEKLLKDYQHIKQNPVEEAKEIYNRYFTYGDQDEFLHVYGMQLVDKLKCAIEYLENKLEWEEFLNEN